MKLKGIMLSEIHSREKIPHDFTYKWNLKINNKKGFIECVLMVARG